jgi:pimeloyl-ACP methyl ester carboxylesterase
MSHLTGAFAECQASNGLYYRVIGRGAPLLLLHGLMVSGATFDPLVELLRDDFRMLIPDLRGHGKSAPMGGPLDVATLAGDLKAAMAESGFGRGAVLGYSHGGAVAQALARAQPEAVSQLLLTCTFACTSARFLLGLLSFASPGVIATLFVRPHRIIMPGLTAETAAWLRAIIAANGRETMHAATVGLANFDSRPWLKDLRASALVIAAANDIAVRPHHFETLTSGIPGARGVVVPGAGHTLLWTHTETVAELIRQHCRRP